MMREAIVTVVLPHRSARNPATRLPKPPTPMTAKETMLAQDGLMPSAEKLARRKRGIQTHIAYSSHMCPRYPRFARTISFWRESVRTYFQLKGGVGVLNGPSFTKRPARRPPARADIAETSTTNCQSATPPKALMRCGEAVPTVSAPTMRPMPTPLSSFVHVAMIFIPTG